MNVYKIDVLVKKEKDYEIAFSFPIKAQNKEEALQSISRNDVQSLINLSLPTGIRKTIKIHISFNDKLIYEISQKL